MPTGNKGGATAPRSRRARKQLMAKVVASRKQGKRDEHGAQQVEQKQIATQQDNRRRYDITRKYANDPQQGRRKLQEAGLLPSKGVYVPVHGGLGVLAKIVGNVAEDAYTTPGGLVKAGGAVKGDIGASTRGDLSFKRSRKLGTAIGKTTLEQVEHPGRRPGDSLLLALAAVSGGASTAGRVAEAGRVARAGEGALATSRALVRKPPLRSRLIEHGDLKIPLQPSKNQLVRGAQAVHDVAVRRALKHNPEGRVASYATKRLGGSLDETRRYRASMQAVPAKELEQSGKKLNRIEQAALRLTSEQSTPEEAIRFHEQQLAKGVNPKQQRRQLKLLGAVRDRGMVKLDETRPEGERVHIDAARHPALAKVDAMLAKGGAERDVILERTGQMTGEGLRTRANAPGLVRAGEKMSGSHEQAAARLAQIESVYDTVVDKMAASYDAKSASAITAGRNVRNARVHPARRMPTVKQEARQLAEEHLTKLLEKNDQPAMQKLNRLLDEAAALRTQLEAQHEANAFGSDTRPGRNYVPYYRTERRRGRSAVTAAPGAVIGKVRGIVPKTKTFTGKALEQADVPENTTGLAARQMERAYRYANSDEFRRTVAKTGNRERRTSRDVLVNKQHFKNAKVPEDLRTQLTGGTLTLEELSGHAHAFDAWRQRILPGVADRFKAERDVPIGTAAPKGFVWVDRHLLGELGHQASLGRGRVARVADKINAAQTAATVYYKIGHVPTRVGTNAVANIIQGSLHPVQVTHSVRLWRSLTPTDRLRALAAAGEGGFAALPANEVDAIGRAASAGAHWWSKHADAPFRFNSLAFEARKAGYKTAADFKRLLDALQNPSHLNPTEAAKVDAIAKRANREQIAYNRLNETERRYLRRVVWFYPWVSGSVRFAGNTILEHPLKTEATVALGREGGVAQQRELGPLPSYAQGLFKVGGTKAQPRVMDLSTVSPFATPHEVAEAAIHANHPAETEQLSRYLNPAARLAAGLVFHLDDQGQPSKSSTVHNALQSLIGTTPELHLAQQIQQGHEDQSRRMYPTNPHDTLTRFLGGTEMPRTLNRDVANERAVQERPTSRTPAERAYRTVFKRRQAFFGEAKRLDLLVDGRLPKPLRDAFDVEAARQSGYASATRRANAKPGTPEYHLARLKVDAHLLFVHKQISRDAAEQMVGWADAHAHDIEAIKHARRYLSDTYYQADDGFLTLINASKNYLEEQGAKGLN